MRTPIATKEDPVEVLRTVRAIVEVYTLLGAALRKDAPARAWLESETLK